MKQKPKMIHPNETLADALTEIWEHARDAIAAGETLQHLMTARQSSTDLCGIPIDPCTENDHEYLSWLVKHLATSEGITWAGYATEVWTAPRDFAGPASEYPDRGKAIVAIVATKWRTVRLFCTIDRAAKSVSDPEITVLDSKPYPKGLRQSLAAD
jgi:hypothetical protein